MKRRSLCGAGYRDGRMGQWIEGIQLANIKYRRREGIESRFAWTMQVEDMLYMAGRPRSSSAIGVRAYSSQGSRRTGWD